MINRKNFLFNAAGIALPLVMALISIPLLISNIGLPRFGVLSLMLAAIGYVSLLDMGLGSAVTYKLSSLIPEKGSCESALLIIRSSLTAVLAVGVIFAVIIFYAAELVANKMSGPSVYLTDEIFWSLRVFAFSIPVIFVTSLLTGILSAYGRFDEINKVKIPVGIFSYLGPAVVSIWMQNLTCAIVVLLVVRVSAALVHTYQCNRLFPTLFNAFPVFSLSVLRPLFHFGGWLTLSNIISPVMVYMDRFYIGAIRSVEDVARYVTPYEVATKLSLIPAAVLPVLFPVFVSNWAKPNENSGHLTVVVASWAAIGCAFPAALLAIFAPQILQMWLGSYFPSESAIVLQILAGGVFANCVALVFFIQVQSFGRTDIIAKIHLSELLGYLFILWFLTQRFGIIGAALAWNIRVLIDGGLFCWVACARLTESQRRICWVIYTGSVAFAIALGALSLLDSWMQRTIVLVFPMVLAWFYRANFFLLLAGKSLEQIFITDEQAS